MSGKVREFDHDWSVATLNFAFNNRRNLRSQLYSYLEGSEVFIWGPFLASHGFFLDYSSNRFVCLMCVCLQFTFLKSNC